MGRIDYHSADSYFLFNYHETNKTPIASVICSYECSGKTEAKRITLVARVASRHSMDYFFHSYPKELAQQIVSRWGPPSDAFDTLPPEEPISSFYRVSSQQILLRHTHRSVL